MGDSTQNVQKNHRFHFSGTGRVFSAFGRRVAALPRRVRFAAALLALPLAAGGASGAYYMGMHRLASQMTLAGLPDTSFPTTSQRILVLSPHCDDETLGAGGLISDARRKGIPVQIVFFTNGDAFRFAATRKLGKLSVGRQDLIRFAEMRQTEALLAAHEMGVDAADVRFFGYPDQGLKPLWERNWSDAFPYKSPYTGRNYNPYPNSATPAAPYTGMAVIRDLRRVMEDFRPTDILVTHPADDHPDHSAAASFAQAALNAEKTSGASWAGEAHLHYYIVHRGDWPYPQGLHTELPLLPPPGLSASLESWRVYPVSQEGEEAKARALNRYVSQTAVMGRFLRSFLRENELFAEGKEAATVAGTGTPPSPAPVDKTDKTDKTKVKNNAPKPGEVRDSVGDTALRYADPSADITGISVRRDGEMLRVRVALRGEPSRRVRYQLSLRSVLTRGDAADPTGAFVTHELPARPSLTNKRALEAAIPLHDLSFTPETEGTVWANVETHWLTNRSMPVDKTGYREFALGVGR